MSQDNKVEVKIKKALRITKPVRINRELHKLLKEKAAKVEVTMSFLLDEIIQEYYQIGYRLEDYQDNQINHEELRTTI